MNQVDEALKILKSSKQISCREMVSLLKGLGFEVFPHSTASHKAFSHLSISGLYGNFNCGHSRGENVKPPYKSQIRKIVDENAEELKEFLEKKRNG